MISFDFHLKALTINPLNPYHPFGAWSSRRPSYPLPLETRKPSTLYPLVWQAFLTNTLFLDASIQTGTYTQNRWVSPRYNNLILIEWIIQWPSRCMLFTHFMMTTFFITISHITLTNKIIFFISTLPTIKKRSNLKNS